MFKFKEFLIKEEDSSRTKVQEIKTTLSQKFDEIKKAKDSKKPGDIASEIASIDKQAGIYQEISVLMKSLSAEIKKIDAGGSKENIY
jgi:RNA polymerase-binding transcription factor DksA